MDRKKLFKLPEINKEDYNALEKLLSIIETKIDDEENCDAEMKKFHEIANKESFYDKYHFETYWKSTSKEEFLEDILFPNPPKIENISLEEIWDIVKQFEEGTIGSLDYYLSLLEKSTGYLYGVSDLIYWPETIGYNKNLTSKEIAKIIFTNEKPPKDLPPPIIAL